MYSKGKIKWKLSLANVSVTKANEADGQKVSEKTGSICNYFLLCSA